MDDSSNQRSPRQLLAERFAPVLMVWPEIPADRTAGSRLRDRFARLGTRSASKTIAGAHITRDFYPRDIRLILNHAQAWDPRPPLPVLSLWFTRAYRDFARFFFWPIAAMVLATLVILTLGQALEGLPKTAVDVGALIFLGALYLTTLRSPVLTPVDSWHHLNHVIVVGGLATAWLVTFGSGGLRYIAIIMVVPSAAVLLTSVLVREFSGFITFVLWPVRIIRSTALWALNRRTHFPPRLRMGLVQGVKPAHEYTVDSELFYRHPRDSKPIHRADRDSHWSAYSRILAREENRYPVTFYARVLDPNADGITAIQYWFCYYYNDWAIEHQGDWESALVLVRGTDPIAVAISSHEAGELRHWEHVEHKGNRPVLHVAAGSHSFYYESGAFLVERAVAGLRVTSIDAALFGKEIMDYVDFAPDETEGSSLIPDQIVLIPDPDEATGLWGHLDHDKNCTGNCAFNFEWMNYQGRWGAVGLSISGGYSGPRGPAESGLPWDNPYLWANTVCRPCTICEGEAGHSEKNR